MVIIAPATLTRVRASAPARWGCAAVIVVALGITFEGMRLPAAWLIAAMLGAGVAALLSGHELKPAARSLKAAQVVVGVVAAEPLTKLTWSHMFDFAGVAVFSISVTLALSLAFGMALAVMARNLSAATAQLSMIAGGASTIASMARELGADQRYVALSQYLRLTIVVASLPIVLSQLGAHVNSAGGAAHESNPLGLLGLVAVGVVGAKLAARTPLPAPFLLGPLFLTAAIAMVWPPFVTVMNPAAVLVNLAYIVIGLEAGGGFSGPALRMFVKLLPLTLAFIAATIGSCYVVAMMVSQWAGVSLADAYLATTPGGIYGVLAAADQIDSGPIVVTLQVLRMLVMVLAAGMIPNFVRWIEARWSPAQEVTVRDYATVG